MRCRRSGRPSIPVGDIVAALAIATYFNRPSRKAASVVQMLNCTLGGGSPASITLRLAMRQKSLNKWIRRAIELTANCVRNIETRFAVDSTYFKTPNYSLVVQRRGKQTKTVYKVKTAKAHVAVALKTLMAVGVEVSDGEANDGAFFRPVLRQFQHRFKIGEVLADAAYDDRKNFEAVAACGGRAFLDQAANARPRGTEHHDDMLRFRKWHYDRWYDVYRFRALIECANSSVKRTIKRVIRARNVLPRENEILLVWLVYNLLRLIEARIEFGIDIDWAGEHVLAEIDVIRFGGRKAA
jgi:hypothetical protein